MAENPQASPAAGRPFWGRFVPLASLGLGIFLIGTYFGVYIARVRGQAPDWDPSRSLVPGVRCLDANQDLGAVYQTDDFQIKFHLVNDSKAETFDINPLHGGCACTKVEPQSLKLGPGEKATVTAFIDLEAGLARESLPKEFSESVIGIAKTAQGDNLPLKMSAKCIVQGSYRVAPEALAFGEVVKGDPAEKGLEVECLSLQPVQRMDVVSAPAGAAASIQMAGEDGKRFRLTARIKPEAPYGLLQGRIRFRAVLATGPFVTRSAAIMAIVVDDLYALPSAVLLGPVTVGDVKTVLVTLQSHHGEAFVIEGVEGTTKSLTVQEKDSPSASIHRYDLSLNPTTPGPVQEVIKFQLKSASGRQYVLTLPVAGYAAGPQAP